MVTDRWRGEPTMATVAQHFEEAESEQADGTASGE